MKKTLFKVLSAIFFIALIFSVIAFATSAEDNYTCKITIDGEDTYVTTDNLSDILAGYRSTSNKDITFTLLKDLPFGSNGNAKPSKFQAKFSFVTV